MFWEETFTHRMTSESSEAVNPKTVPPGAFTSQRWADEEIDGLSLHLPHLWLGKGPGGRVLNRIPKGAALLSRDPPIQKNLSASAVSARADNILGLLTL